MAVLGFCRIPSLSEMFLFHWLHDSLPIAHYFIILNFFSAYVLKQPVPDQCYVANVQSNQCQTHVVWLNEIYLANVYFVPSYHLLLAKLSLLLTQAQISCLSHLVRYFHSDCVSLVLMFANQKS